MTTAPPLPAPAETLWAPEPLFSAPREGRTIERIEDPPERARAQAFVNRHHSYIRWAQRPSRRIYWNLFEDNQHVGVFGLSSCFSHPKAVKQFLAAHEIPFNGCANNIVYCLAGAGENAGSQFLALCRRDGARWWEERYGDELRCFQTFILPPRTGAVYKADNWTMLGMTKGETWSTRTIPEDQVGKLPNTRTQRFADGSVRYLQNDYRDIPRKLIFMRLA